MPRSRNDAQFKVIYYLWRNHATPEMMEQITREWIRNYHNGKSDTVKAGRWAQIYREIAAQVERVLTYQALPDAPHNSYFGHVTIADVEQIVFLAGGNLPLIKFLFNLIRWYRPRRHRDRVRLHVDFLLEWTGARWKGRERYNEEHGTDYSGGASTNYRKRLHQLEAMGLITRGSAYLVGSMSKQIIINPKLFCFTDGAPVLIDGRSGGLRETVAEAFQPRDFRALLIQAGMSPQAAHQFLRATFDPKS